MISLQTELAQVTVDERVHLVSVRAIEKTRPLQGSGEEFAGAGLLFRREMPAGEQQTEVNLRR